MLTKDDLKEIEKLLKPIKRDISEMKGTVDANNVSIIKIENTIGVYKDALDTERKRIDKHDGRLGVIEDSLDLSL